MKKLYIFVLLTLAMFVNAAPSEAKEKEPVYPVVVLGGGIGGLTSGLYLARAGLQPLVIEGPLAGGLLTQSHAVQNWPGETEIHGAKLVEKIHAQAKTSGATFLQAEVIGVDFSKKPFTLHVRDLTSLKQYSIYTNACIIAMGAEPKLLNIPGEKEYWGQGVSNCAICDGGLYRNKRVAVIGGSDAAILEALHLSSLAKEVTLVVRGPQLKTKEMARLKTLLSTPNVTVFYNTEVKAICGDSLDSSGGLTHVVLTTRRGSEFTAPVDGVFLAIGSRPNTSLFKDVLKLTPEGFIALENGQQTSLQGVFAAGDIVDPVYKQAVSAAGDGAKAALEVEKFLSDQQKSEVDSKSQIESGLPLGVIEVTSLEHFEKELKESTLPLVVDFYASWCTPCKQISPLFLGAAKKLGKKYKFLKVNVDQFYSLSHQYGIRGMPTVLILDPKGGVKERALGVDEILRLLERVQKVSLALEPSPQAQ